MNMIYSSFRHFCPVIGKVMDIHYRILADRNISTFSSCEYYKPCPTCEHCAKAIRENLNHLSRKANRDLTEHS